MRSAEFGVLLPKCLISRICCENRGKPRQAQILRNAPICRLVPPCVGLCRFAGRHVQSPKSKVESLGIRTLRVVIPHSAFRTPNSQAIDFPHLMRAVYPLTLPAAIISQPNDAQIEQAAVCRIICKLLLDSVIEFQFSIAPYQP
jgi:hypothetical protein